MASNALLFDSHAHLLDKRFSNDYEDVGNKIHRLICVYSPGEDAGLFKKLLTKNNIWGIAGIHPHDAKDYGKRREELIKALALDKIVALGEIGLDFYYDNSPREEQIEVFNKQLSLACEKNLPVVVHSRDAYKEVMDALASYELADVLIHCFSGTVEEMRETVERGYSIAVGGVITFPKAMELKKVVKEVPLDKLILETDCPYLAPVPKRGKRNEPVYIEYTAKEAALIKGLDYNEFTQQIYQNTNNFFGIDI